MEPVTPQELSTIRHLVANLRRTDRNGNYMNKFSARTIGRGLFRKMNNAGWLQWAGFYLNGRTCFRLTPKGRREAKSLSSGLLK
jgi:hypothetical protein